MAARPILTASARKTLVRPGERLKWGIWPLREFQLHPERVTWQSTNGIPTRDQLYSSHSGELSLDAENERLVQCHTRSNARQLTVTDGGHELHIEFSSQEERDTWAMSITAAVNSQREEAARRAAEAARQQEQLEPDDAGPSPRALAMYLCCCLLLGCVLIAYLQSSHGCEPPRRLRTRACKRLGR